MKYYTSVIPAVKLKVPKMNWPVMKCYTSVISAVRDQVPQNELALNEVAYVS